jgi:hypothetical protein
VDFIIFLSFLMLGFLAAAKAAELWNAFLDDAEEDDPWGEEQQPWIKAIDITDPTRDDLHHALEALTAAADDADNIEALWFVDQLRNELLKSPLPEHEVTPLTPTKDNMLGQPPITAEACCDYEITSHECCDAEPCHGPEKKVQFPGPELQRRYADETHAS